MKISIVRTDNMVYVDGVGLPVDLSSLRAGVSAVQWDDAAESGHIEYLPGPSGRCGNETISAFDEFSIFVKMWNDSRSARAAAAAAEEARIEEEKDRFRKSLDAASAADTRENQEQKP